MSVQLQGGEFVRGGDFLPELPMGHPDPDMPTQRRGGSVPRFFRDKVAIETDQGTVYRDVERVEIIVPGDMKGSPVVKVTDLHRQRWPREYDAFKRGLKPTTTGEPIEYWGGLSPAQIATLKAFNVQSVEDIAGLSDTQIQNLGMGMRTLVERAKARVASRTSPEALAERQAVENQSLRDQLGLQKAQLDQALQAVELFRQQMAHLTTGVQMGTIQAPTSHIAPQPMQGGPVPRASIEGAFGPLESQAPIAQAPDGVTPFGTFQPAVPTQDGPDEPRRGPGRPRKIG